MLAAPMARRFLSGWELLGLALAAVIIALRVHNALDYPLDKGFDATRNWEYVELLLEDWRLPAPDESWSTAHPPLFFWVAAGLGRLFGSGKEATVAATRLAGAAAGLGIAALAMLLASRADRRPRRALLAGALVGFLPVHVYTSAMLSDEIWVASLSSLAVVGAAWDLGGPSPRLRPARAAALGAVAGLALLTKLSGLLSAAAIAGAYAVVGWRSGEARRGLGCALLALALAGAVGGWFYVRNLVGWGYLYPHGLDVHTIMFSMPPGSRGLGDYLYVPLATILDPRLLSPPMLRSVWGSTYASAWFDAHRHFLPREGDGVLAAARLLVALGLLPTLAFAVGAARGARRLLRSRSGVDAVLLLLTAVTLGGYVLFTWRNPWFATLKAGHLLVLCVPFAYYASEALAHWTPPGRWWSAAVWLALAALAAATVATFWHGLVFAKYDDPGLQWLLPADLRPH
jgi:hypothetical protein